MHPLSVIRVWGSARSICMHDAKQHDLNCKNCGDRNIVRFDQNRSCHQMFGERWFSRSFVDQHCWHNRVDEICESNTLTWHEEAHTQPVPIDLLAMGSQDQQFQGNCSWCGILRSHGERLVERKPKTCKPRHTNKRRTTDGKGKPGTGKGKTKNQGK